MLDLTVGERQHDHTQRVAQKHSKGVVDGVGVLTSRLGKIRNEVGEE